MPLALLFVKSCFHQGIGQHLLLSAEPGECVTYTHALFMMIETSAPHPIGSSGYIFRTYYWSLSLVPDPVFQVQPGAMVLFSNPMPVRRRLTYLCHLNFFLNE